MRFSKIRPMSETEADARLDIELKAYERQIERDFEEEIVRLEQEHEKFLAKEIKIYSHLEQE